MRFFSTKRPSPVHRGKFRSESNIRIALGGTFFRVFPRHLSDNLRVTIIPNSNRAGVWRTTKVVEDSDDPGQNRQLGVVHPHSRIKKGMSSGHGTVAVISGDGMVLPTTHSTVLRSMRTPESSVYLPTPQWIQATEAASACRGSS